MSLRPRHYLLILVLLGIGAWNLYRRHAPPAATALPAPAIAMAPPAQTPTWAAFDHAAALRDAPETDFLPALQLLQQQIAADPSPADAKGCLTWLDFYRQGALHPSNDPQWKQRSERHLNGCLKFHLDTTAG